ncbi:PREDICTED: polymerase I and transcript release factor [Bison bison bison]|uniref:Polymerase I and transcript release factor n=1 Tax=Bison bison bison TaxID=43346 RepID=A0A6P3HSC5_BISBB|nr:PREDICTED: polymerase I and transcript release factor [Bison bison bison]
MEDTQLHIIEQPLSGYPDAGDQASSTMGAPAAEEPSGAGSEELIKSDQVNGVLVLSLLDKIIGAVDQIQLTQAQLEERQGGGGHPNPRRAPTPRPVGSSRARVVARGVPSPEGSGGGEGTAPPTLAPRSGRGESPRMPAGAAEEPEDKRPEAGAPQAPPSQLPKKKLNAPSDRATPKIVPFDLLPETEPFDLKPETVPDLPPFDQTPRTLPYYPEPTGPLPTPEEPTDEVKLPAKVSIGKSLKESETLPEKEGDELAEGERPEEDAAALELSSDEAVEVEEVIEESRAERIKRSGLRRVDDFKKAFSKEKMEKTKVRTRENLERTRLKTKENLEKTRHTLEKRMNKLGTRLVPAERREKLKSSRDKLRKSFTPDHVVYARSKTAVYKVPPFTFHVKKIREGQVEVLKATEMVEVGAEEEEGGAERGEAADLLRGSSPDVHTLLEITEESDAVLVDKSDSD